MGGHRIDYVRQAMALSYPIMQSDLSRKWAPINIADILPVLLKLVQEVVMILGAALPSGRCGLSRFRCWRWPRRNGGRRNRFASRQPDPHGPGIVLCGLTGLPVHATGRSRHRMECRKRRKACGASPHGRLGSSYLGKNRTCCPATGPWTGAASAVAADSYRDVPDTRIDESWRDEQHGEHCAND